MKDDISNVIPSAMEFAIDGVMYKFAPITIGDLAALGNNIKQEHIKQFREACAGMEPALIAAGIESIIKDGSDVPLSSPVAMVFLLHRSISKNHPEITLEQVGDMMSHSNFAEAVAILESLGGSVKN